MKHRTRPKIALEHSFTYELNKIADDKTVSFTFIGKPNKSHLCLTFRLTSL
jgi:hypothetical protein